MAFSKEIEDFINHFVDELEDHNVAVFAGAGLSAGSKAVDWRGLLREIAQKLGLDVDRETDLVSVAQYYLNKNPNNRNELNQRILNAFHHGISPNQNHRILARLPIGTYWTTNYDRLIERSLEDANKVVDVKISTQSLANTVDGRQAILYKMHGDVNEPNQAILAKDDYERYYRTHEAFVSALSGLLISKTFLFVGFSFEDPNLDYIFGRIRTNFSDNMRRHYCFFKRVVRGENETEEEAAYRATKQELVARDLERFNVNVLFIDRYEDITEILREISRRYQRNTVYVSGSAHEYGDWDPKAAEVFISKLSKELVTNGFKIVSGFGLGVGSFVINGVLEEVYMNRRENLGDQLLLRPFPQGEMGLRLWTAYRKDMIGYAGIAIYIFGNKIVDGEVVIADGVIKEFEIASEQGVVPIPVPSTGYAAKQIYDLVIGDPERFLGPLGWLQDELKGIAALGTDDEKIIDGVLRVINRLKENPN